MSYPTSAKVFTTKTNGPGNVIDASHINDVQTEITAIEQDLLTAFPTGVAAGVIAGGWTPVIGGSGGTSGQTYATQLGTYVKVGQLVFVGFDVTLTVKGTITNNVQIQGLPFVSGVIAHGMSLDGINILASSVVSVSGNLAAGEQAVTVLIRTAAAAAPSVAVTADIANNTRFSGSFCYRAVS